MKKVFSFVLIAVLCIGVVPVYASESVEITYGVSVNFDGIPIGFDEEPFIMNGRTYLPVRTVAELVGLNVDFEPGAVLLTPGGTPTARVFRHATTTRTVTAEIVYGVHVSFHGIFISFAEDSRPFIMDGRTYLPVRTIAELVGLNVEFENGVVRLSAVTPTPVPAPTPSPAPMLSSTPAPAAQPQPERDDRPVIALTFDDGPNNTITPRILDELEARGIVATFFVIGQNINSSTAPVMRRAHTLGNEFANHSAGYSSMGAMTEEQIIASLTSTDDKIIEILGEEARPRFFRPPNLNTSPAMIATVRDYGFPIATGITANDWEASATVQSIHDRIVPNVRDGSIILLHDGTSNATTADAIGSILDALTERGFRFVTLSELFEIKGVTPEAGRTYNSVN
jgi:peptidoglycan/xylan/chitin deacetylase (PgdA/CDA1 family)